MIQIEITTHCNYECFYCAGRDMPQRHMSWTAFLGILDRVAAPRRTVNLQGEGEPTTHPRFFDMAAEVARRGLIPYAITNGSCGRHALIARRFPRIGISLDTLDPAEAERIGRHKLARTLANLDALLARMGAARLIIHTVDYGQPLAALRQYVRARGIETHIVQPLQQKDDYAYRYRDRLPIRLYRPEHRCRYIDTPMMRYFSIDGLEMPCCFIKDTSKFVSTEHIRQSLAARAVPQSCAGCREILRPVPAAVRATSAATPIDSRDGLSEAGA